MIIDAYAKRKEEQVMQDTWGHLAPKINKTYKGTMIYAHSVYGDIVLLYSNFKNLDDSPWLFEAMQDYLSEHCENEGVYQWEGRLTVHDCAGYCFGGEIERIDFINIFLNKPLT